MNFLICTDVCYSALKIRLKPTEQQISKFWQFCGARRVAYNWALFTVEEDYDNGTSGVDVNDLLKRFNKEKKTNKKLKFFSEISCDVAKQAIKDCGDAYTRFFKLQKEDGYEKFTKKTVEHSGRVGKELTRIDMNGHPKLKCKKNRKKDSFYLDWYQLEIGEGFVHIPKIGKVKTRNSHKGLQTFPLKERGSRPKMINCTVSWDGKYWILTASFEVSKEELSVPKSKPIGIDLGIKEMSVCSDGTVFKNINKGKKIKALKKKKKRLQRNVSRKFRMNEDKETSKNAKNVLNQIRLIDRKLTNLRTNYRHQISNDIVKRNPSLVILENLNVKGMMKNKHLSDHIWEQGWYTTSCYFEQKCERFGIPFIKADRWYASSKTCNNCGFVKKDLKLNNRIYKCPQCGKVIDRDLNAALNLRDYGLTQIQ